MEWFLNPEIFTDLFFTQNSVWFYQFLIELSYKNLNTVIK